MDRDDDGETSYKYNTFVDDVAIEPTYLQALPTAAGRNVATIVNCQIYSAKLGTLIYCRPNCEHSETVVI